MPFFVLVFDLPVEDVDCRVFDEGTEDKHQADGHPHVDSLDVGDAGQTRTDGGRLRRHGEHGQ